EPSCPTALRAARAGRTGQAGRRRCCQRNLRESDLSDQFPQATDDADRIRLRAACSSHRRIREGVCVTRSSALLQLFALPQCVARLASIRSVRLLPSQAFEADSKPTPWRRYASSHLRARDRNGKSRDRLGGRRVREADYRYAATRAVPFPECAGHQPRQPCRAPPGCHARAAPVLPAIAAPRPHTRYPDSRSALGWQRRYSAQVLQQPFPPNAPNFSSATLALRGIQRSRLAGCRYRGQPCWSRWSQLQVVQPEQRSQLLARDTWHSAPRASRPFSSGVRRAVLISRLT